MVAQSASRLSDGDHMRAGSTPRRGLSRDGKLPVIQNGGKYEACFAFEMTAWSAIDGKFMARRQLVVWSCHGLKTRLRSAAGSVGTPAIAGSMDDLTGRGRASGTLWRREGASINPKLFPAHSPARVERPETGGRVAAKDPVAVHPKVRKWSPCATIFPVGVTCSFSRTQAGHRSFRQPRTCLLTL
jgi:hypothetical protein